MFDKLRELYDKLRSWFVRRKLIESAPLELELLQSEPVKEKREPEPEFQLFPPYEFEPEARPSQPAVETLKKPEVEEEVKEPPQEEPKLNGGGEDLNRKQRRYMAKLERLRRKKDVFVQPQGTPPVHIPRAKSDKPRLPRTQKEESVDVGPYIAEDTACGEELVAWSEIWGEFNFRDTILDQLDRYWTYLSRMQKRDPDAYHFYRQVGSTILPLAGLGMYHGLTFHHKDDKPPPEAYSKPAQVSRWFHENRPAFGCYAYGISSKIEEQEINPPDWYRKEHKRQWLWIPKFMYFVKYHLPPPEIQPMTGGDTYKMTVWWDQPKRNRIARMKGGAPTEYGVWISRDGEQIVVLRMIETKMIPIQYRKHKPKHRREFYIPQRLWHIPDEFEKWAKANGTTAQHFLSHLFADSTKTFEHSNYSMVRVNVHKENNMTAVFGVNIHRMSYFFQDRDYVLHESGVRKKIFHIVRSHERHYQDGRMIPIKMHFRGEKQFTWAGYHVDVTIPGKDHVMLPEFNVGLDDSYWVDPKDMGDVVSEEEYGKMLADHIKGKKFGDTD